jgi:hypothetical protein
VRRDARFVQPLAIRNSAVEPAMAWVFAENPFARPTAMLFRGSHSSFGRASISLGSCQSMWTKELLAVADRHRNRSA